MGRMEQGKLPSELLRKLVFKNIKGRNPHVILRPEIGEDCAAIEFEDYACILSTDPITGADKGVGTLAVHISCNDIASCGVKPIGIMITLLVPVDGTEEDIHRVMKEAGEAASELGVEIIGGHTEITTAVNKMVISTTAIGKVKKDKIITTRGAMLGDDVVMTKWAGLEGTSIIASDQEKELYSILDKEEIQEAKSFVKYISVVPEGVLAGEFGVNSMHDVTEGGVLGAAWEVAEISGTGIEIYIDNIPIKEVTQKICNHYKISPYRLISSGSMIMSCKDGNKLVELLGQNGIKAAMIGKVTEKEKLIVNADGTSRILEPPGADELFKIV